MTASRMAAGQAVAEIEPIVGATTSPGPSVPIGIPSSLENAVHATDADGDLATTLLMIAADLSAIGVTFALSYWLRFGTSLFSDGASASVSVLSTRAYGMAGVVIALVYVLIFGQRGMYAPRRNISLSEEFVSVLKATSMGMLLVLSAAFFYREVEYSRLMFLFFWATGTLLVFGGRAGTIAWERRRYRAGLHVQKTVIIGGGAVAGEVFGELDGHEAFGISIQGYFAAADASADSKLGATRRLGTPSQAVRYIKDRGINLVLIAVDSREHEQAIEIIRECEGSNINLLMVPDFLSKVSARVKVKELGRIPFIDLRRGPLTIWGHILKRAIDIVVSAGLLVMLAPLLALLAVLVRLTSPGPVLFVQRRVGFVGKEFSMYKFRSMRAGSEKTDRLAGLGIKNDSRCTRLGAFMRKTSLDELPQLFNVLRGDMSLVGPRPERTHCVEDFKHTVPRYVERHRVKTGMTGWAQVNGLRGDTSLTERIKHDLYYIENWSPALDVRILLQTVRAVVQK